MKRDSENSGNLDQLLRTAIHAKRLVTFALDGTRRVGEPHDYGIINGVPKLFFWQTGGESRSGRPVGWRWAETRTVGYSVRDRLAPPGVDATSLEPAVLSYVPVNDIHDDGYPYHGKHYPAPVR
jgi:hypothetical protein